MNFIDGYVVSMTKQEAKQVVRNMLRRCKQNEEGNLDYDMFTKVQYVALQMLVYSTRKNYHYQLKGEDDTLE